MPKSITDDHEWIVKHLAPLMKAGREIQELDENLPTKSPPTYDKGYWTALKLLLLKYYIKPYLDILGSRGSLAYIDLFAGPGLNLLGKNRVPLPGSSMTPLVIKESKYDFSFFCYCDLESSYSEALEKRCSSWSEMDSVTILNQDANEVADNLFETLKEREIDHSLVFIDPEGLELKWNPLQRLIETIECDLIINFPSAGLVRLLGCQDSSTAKTVSAFLGIVPTDMPPDADEDWAIGVYRENLARLGKDISMEIRVMGTNSFHYHLIPAVRRTYRGSPWFGSIFGGAKERIERISPGVLGIVAEQIEGSQDTII